MTDFLALIWDNRDGAFALVSWVLMSAACAFVAMLPWRGRLGW